MTPGTVGILGTPTMVEAQGKGASIHSKAVGRTGFQIASVAALLVGVFILFSSNKARRGDDGSVL
ncbi:MAG: hypothetical protein JO031_14125 [Ktedonobacteraceae bacterium]|nr:hypothetical protein [Ktedonobacteraceae bacterium]